VQHPEGAAALPSTTHDPHSRGSCFKPFGAVSGAVSVDRDRSRSRLEKMTWYSDENVAERVGVDPSYLVRLVDRAERHHS
jgi:hypothetical protein